VLLLVVPKTLGRRVALRDDSFDAKAGGGLEHLEEFLRQIAWNVGENVRDFRHGLLRFAPWLTKGEMEGAAITFRAAAPRLSFLTQHHVHHPTPTRMRTRSSAMAHDFIVVAPCFVQGMSEIWYLVEGSVVIDCLG
jgi:hypothetical protein